MQFFAECEKKRVAGIKNANGAGTDDSFNKLAKEKKDSSSFGERESGLNPPKEKTKPVHFEKIQRMLEAGSAVINIEKTGAGQGV